MLQDLIMAFDKFLEWICYGFWLTHFLPFNLES
jgi:hypothetical protein